MAQALFERHDRHPRSRRETRHGLPWIIADSDLPPELRYRVDAENSGHGFLEPAREMTLSEYEIAIDATRKLWRKVPTP
jgi:hypothetical protein